MCIFLPDRHQEYYSSMPVSYEISFLPNGPVEKFAGSRGNYYKFDDGSHQDVLATPVWCRCCKKVTEGEELRSLWDIDKTVAELRLSLEQAIIDDQVGRTSRTPKGWTQVLRGRIEETIKLRQWRVGRSSAPKCLLCGSTDIFAFPVGSPVQHPAGTGMIEIRCVGLCSTNFNEWFFTPEGDRIVRRTWA